MSAMLCVFFGLFLGGAGGSATGLGAMLIGLSILSMGIPTTDAVLVCCMTGAIGCFQLMWLYRKEVRWSEVRWMWIGCVPGCVLGAYTLKVVPVHLLQIMVSVSIVGFVLLQLLGSKADYHIKDSAHSLGLAGFAGGFFHSSISVVGVPIGIFVLLKKWDRMHAMGAMSMFYFLSGWITMASQWGAGLYRMDLLGLAAAGLAGQLLGQQVGFRLGKRLDQRLFKRFVLLFLSVSAGILFYKALW